MRPAKFETGSFLNRLSVDAASSLTGGLTNGLAKNLLTTTVVVMSQNMKNGTFDKSQNTLTGGGVRNASKSPGTIEVKHVSSP